MAVDTPTKRSSALFVRTRSRRFLPVPDGTIAVADRAHLAGVYYEVAAVVAIVQTKRTVCIGTSLARSVMVGTSTVQTQMIGTDP